MTFSKLEENEFSDEPIARQKSQTTVERTVIFVIPFGVPGSGKSTILTGLKAKIESMDSSEWTFDSISSDGIRAGLMAPLIEAGKTKDQAFQ